MSRLVQTARWLWRYSLVCLLPVAWGLMTWLVHAWMPVTPARQFDLWNANRICDGVDWKTAWDQDDRRRPMVMGVAPDGETICTVTRTDGYWPYVAHYSGPVRLWDLRKQVLKAEWDSPQINGSPNDSGTAGSLIHGEWLARRIVIPPEVKGDWRHTRCETEFVHIRSGRVGRNISTHDFGVSPNGRWLVHGTWDLGVIDLETDTSHTLRGYRAEAPANGHGVSDDGRFLTVTDSGFVNVIDAEKDAVVAKLAAGASAKEPWSSDPVLSPNGDAIAWGIGRKVIVSDFVARQRIVINRASLLGWQPHGHMLVARPDLGIDKETGSRRKTEAVELWDWKSNSCVASWQVPSLDSMVQSRRVLFYHWGDHDPVWIIRSPCTQNVLFARIVQAAPPSKISKIMYDWLWVPLPPSDYLEIYLLDGSSLSVNETFIIPLDIYRTFPEYYSFHITADGQYVVFSDSIIVQHWPIASRRWLQSAAWASGITFALVIVVMIYRIWRKSIRQKIPPTVPPPVPA